MIKANDLVFEYIRRDADQNVIGIEEALSHVDIDIKKGDFVAILGHNGSGKSTFAKHINAILAPTEGSLYINGYDANDSENILNIRQSAGMVFQNPDNQIIGNVVEEDVAFGPENIGVPTLAMRKRIKTALEAVKMYHYRKHSPNKLSGGQKQRVAIAGVMAMESQCIVLDEPTAMLDPGGREDVIKTITALNKEKGITVILITHNMDEVIQADKIYVMDKGKVAAQGTPKEVFGQVSLLKKIGLEVPFVTMLSHDLQKQGLALKNPVIKENDFVMQCEALYEQVAKREQIRIPLHGMEKKKKYSIKQGSHIILDHVNYIYNPGMEYEKKALIDVNLTIHSGEFVAIVGHTGSGKSTLIQHLNGLMKPTSGTVYFNGDDINEKGYSLKELRSKVGLSFQYPEHQLFEMTVVEDVSFGPKNLGLPQLEVEQRCFDAIEAVGLSDEVYDLSPFSLSGGQKRRVALAGVLAMKPEFLILDEPTAGLDPKGRDEILDLIEQYHWKNNMTVVLVSHSMEDVAQYADRMIVMDDGKVAFDDTPRQVFTHKEELEKMGLRVPKATKLMYEMYEAGMPVDITDMTIKEAEEDILNLLR